MAKTQEYKLSSDGLQTTVTDTTLWGVSDGIRSDYAIVCGLIKFSDSGFSPCSLAGSDPINISDENPSFVFTNKNDGYYKIKTIYAKIDDPSNTTEGYIYYSSVSGSLMIYSDGSFSEISYLDAMLYPDAIIEEIILDAHISPMVQQKLDFIWDRYFQSGLPAKGKDFVNFQTGYSMFIGAMASFSEGAFAEYDSKIQMTNKLIKRWL